MIINKVQLQKDVGQDDTNKNRGIQIGHVVKPHHLTRISFYLSSIDIVCDM